MASPNTFILDRNLQHLFRTLIPVVLKDVAGKRKVHLRIPWQWHVCSYDCSSLSLHACGAGALRSNSSNHGHAQDFTDISGKPSAPREEHVQSQPGKRETHCSFVPSEAGKGQEVLVAILAGAGKWSVISMQHCRVSFVLALGTVYGFRENITERNAELSSCTSAEIPVLGNCFHSHFWVCRQVLIPL